MVDEVEVDMRETLELEKSDRSDKSDKRYRVWSTSACVTKT